MGEEDGGEADFPGLHEMIDWRRMLRRGDKVSAVKYYCMLNGVTLAEAHKVVSDFEASLQRIKDGAQEYDEAMQAQELMK